ncbi:unnamed protein product [Auanema sp. JU1783]|nr:unnamed protein product [Auanema sp. JU1783]
MFHRRAHRIVNVLISLCLFGFFVIFLKTPPQPKQDLIFPAIDEKQWKELGEMNSTVDTTYEDFQQWRFKLSANNTIFGREVVESVMFLNENFDILNIDRFGPVEDVKTVIVIQVHNRVAYLRYLIESLKKTKGIEDTLLVFSHDINVEAINQMIHNITFARVYQIFYPLNMQLFPHVFPGQEPYDCPEKIGKARAQLLGCQNKDFPDKYGNYRVAQLTQIKHHWWWKMNFVFDGIIDRFGLHDSWVLLLEEDHLVVPDALYVLNYITEHKNELCNNCDLISLGAYLKSTRKYRETINLLGSHPWFSSKHNMGMALQRTQWLKIKGCAEMFCTWDDYNWDWSVMQVTAKCLPQRFRVIFAKSPRVLHIGDCGVHTHRCTASNAYTQATQLVEEHHGDLFPSSLKVTDISRRSLKPSKENGGWGDKRDHELCRLNTHPLAWNTKDANMSIINKLLQNTIHVPSPIR